MGASLLAKGIFHCAAGRCAWRFFTGKPRVHVQLVSSWRIWLLRKHRHYRIASSTVWNITLLISAPVERGITGNLIWYWHCRLGIWVYANFGEATRDAFVKIGMNVMKNTPSEMFANAIISGWIIATMVWMFPSAGSTNYIGN